MQRFELDCSQIRHELRDVNFGILYFYSLIELALAVREVASEIVTSFDCPENLLSFFWRVPDENGRTKW